MQNPLLPGSSVLPAVRFEGKKKSRPMEPASQKLEKRLLNEGVDGNLLWEKFRVRLWNLRQLKDKVLLKVDTSAAGKLSSQELVRFFEEKLGQQVIIKEKKVKDCCGSQCKGCLADRPDKHQDWRLNRFA